MADSNFDIASGEVWGDDNSGVLDLGSNWGWVSSEPAQSTKESTSQKLKSGGSLGIGSENTGSGGYSAGAPLVFNNDTWNTNVGKTSTITGGQRYGGGYAGSKAGSYSSNTAMAIKDPSYSVSGMSYQRSAMPEYKSTYVAPDENKINSLAMSGGGNALRQSVSNLVNRTVASSAALPLAVRRNMMRGLSENIAETYSKSMPNIRKSASNEWYALYGKPQSEDISAQNQYNLTSWLNQEKNYLSEYLARLNAGMSGTPSQSTGGVISTSYGTTPSNTGGIQIAGMRL